MVKTEQASNDQRSRSIDNVISVAKFSWVLKIYHIEVRNTRRRKRRIVISAQYGFTALVQRITNCGEIQNIIFFLLMKY